jgi:hypothetical protein
MPVLTSMTWVLAKGSLSRVMVQEISVSLVFLATVAVRDILGLLRLGRGNRARGGNILDKRVNVIFATDFMLMSQINLTSLPYTTSMTCRSPTWMRCQLPMTPVHLP